jgi:hypothetical protein
MYTETWLISTTIREGRCTQKHGSSLQQFVKVDVHRSMAHLYNNSWRSMYTETWLISTTIREAGFRDFWEEFNLSDNVLGETFVSICYLQNFPEKKPNWDCTFKDLSFGQACKFMQSYKILMAHFIEWLLFDANSAISQLYHGENKLIFNEMMMKSALY